jgi:quercetin dioxygenase-like cupin family protein
MSKSTFASIVLVVIFASSTTMAQDKHIIKPQTVISEIVEGMPKGDKQQVRVLTATFQPRDQTMFHTHRFPVTVYVLEGAFTLEKEGQQPVTVKTGEAMLMPPNIKMTGYNKSTTERLRLVVFYVSDPDTPFLDAIH